MILLDTGAWVALAMPGDSHSARARTLYSEISRGTHGALATSDYVLDEAVTLTRMSADAAAAVRLSKTILASRSVSVVWIDLEHALAATELLRTHGDKRWSFTDCTSFVVMDRLRIQEAFTFDHSFDEAGFVRLP